MKKIAIMFLAIALVFSLTACRRKQKPEPTEPTVPVTEAPTIIPTIPDVIEPNIPDPSVDDGTLEDLIPGESDGMFDGDQANDTRRIKQ